jgi:hypothetical protein
VTIPKLFPELESFYHFCGRKKNCPYYPEDKIFSGKNAIMIELGSMGDEGEGDEQSPA